MCVSKHVWWALVAAFLLGATACGGDEPSSPEVPSAVLADESGGKGSQAPSASGPDMDWWKRKPQISLYLSGGQRGRLKPCGCSEPQMGGLVRAASVMQQLRKRAQRGRGALAALSLGWSMKGRGEMQEEAKADLLRAVNEALGYSATLLGASDIPIDAMCQSRGESGADLPHPPLNVRLAAVNPAVDATPLVDLSVRNLKVRAVSVLEPEVAESLLGGGLVEGVMTVNSAFEGLTPRPGTLWLIAADVRNDTTLELIKAGVRRLGAAVIVDVSGSGRGTRKLDDAVLEPGGEPVVLELDEYGKAVGVLDIRERGEGTGWTASYRRIELVPQWEKYPGTLVDDVRQLDGIYRTMVRERGYLEATPRFKDQGPTYVGSHACAPCHQAIYRDWSQTSHAVALRTLKEIDYVWDPECIRCHVVGWRRSADDWIVTQSGFRNADATPHLGGVGCESCHGPGSAHIDAPWDESLFAPGGPNVAKTPKSLCITCHDVENSHGFNEDYETYFLPKADHSRVPTDRRVNDPPDEDEPLPPPHKQPPPPPREPK